jgi:non-ribosomal peptide synthetase component E (peptide arylation enzyme)
MWSRKYDKAYGWQAQRERELGAKFRKNKALSVKDLAAVAEWKFKAEPEKLQRAQELAARNTEEKVQRITSQILSLPNADDLYRINCLTTLEGISPVLASIILTFYDPARYGIFDQTVWKGLLGNAPPGLYTPQNYIRLLAALRKTAAKHNLDARVIDKALYKKAQDEAS